MNTTLTFDTPAKEWIEGLPLGNGTIGLMIHGTPGNEIFSLNHDRLWRKNREKRIQTADIIPELRRLVLANKALEAEALFIAHTQEGPDECNAYQPFCDLFITLDNQDTQTSYHRSLDLKTATGSIQYSLRNQSIAYECLVASHADIAIIRLTADSPLTCRISWGRNVDPDCTIQTGYDNSQCTFEGRFPEGTVFTALAAITTNNGTVEWDGTQLHIHDSREILIRIALATSFTSPAPLADCQNAIRTAQAISYDQWKQRHMATHQQLFNRMALDLHAETDKTTEQLYSNMFTAQSIHPALYEQLFHTARYLLMSASRPGTLPVNLQGIWNRDIHPYWESGCTMDMNMQMYYWMAPSCNLLECEKPLFDWIQKNLPKLQKQCRDIFGVSGVHIPQYTDTWFEPTKGCYGPFQVLWSGAAAWIAQHYFEYWKYSGDDEFALHVAYPFMKECARFYQEYLFKNPQGRYECCPSCSPENRTSRGEWLVNSATMDIALVHELMGHLQTIHAQFGLHDPDIERWKDIDKNIVDYPIDAHGCLQEWITEAEQADPYHRHISHIYGIFPGKQFFADPRLHDAAIKALIRRRSGGFGSCATWSHAWYACCFARIGDGNTALSCLNDLMTSGMVHNFLTTHNDWRENSKTGNMVGHKLFQLDALLGVAAAIAEFFVQSFDDRIRILPALPESWAPRGSVSGLRTYGGAEVSLTWAEGRLKQFDIFARKNGTLIFEICAPFDYSALPENSSMSENILTLPVVSGKRYHIA